MRLHDGEAFPVLHWSIQVTWPKYCPVIGQYWSRDPWQVAARRRWPGLRTPMVTPGNSGHIRAIGSGSGEGLRSPPMLWWSESRVMFLTTLVSHQGPLEMSRIPWRPLVCVNFVCRDEAIELWNFIPTLKLYILQSPRHCCIQKIYITIRRTIWGNKFKRKLCPGIFQFSRKQQQVCEECWFVRKGKLGC